MALWTKNIKWGKDHWQFLEELNFILEPSVERIRILEGDKFPTQNLFLLAKFFITTRKNEKKKEMKIAKQEKEELFQVLMAFEIEINLIWDDMPQETLTAS